MKKIIIASSTALIIFLITGCVDEGKDEYIPAGYNTFSITVTYKNNGIIDWGDTSGGGAYPGTGFLYVCLYKKTGDTMPNNYRSPEHLYEGMTEENSGTVEILGIESGEYFVMAFYDFWGSSDNYAPNNIANQKDPYILHSGSDSLTNNPNYATALEIPGDISQISIAFNGDWQFQQGKKFEF